MKKISLNTKGQRAFIKALLFIAVFGILAVYFSVAQNGNKTIEVQTFKLVTHIPLLLAALFGMSFYKDAANGFSRATWISIGIIPFFSVVNALINLLFLSKDFTATIAASFLLLAINACLSFFLFETFGAKKAFLKRGWYLILSLICFILPAGFLSYRLLAPLFGQSYILDNTYETVFYFLHISCIVFSTVSIISNIILVIKNKLSYLSSLKTCAPLLLAVSVLSYAIINLLVKINIEYSIYNHFKDYAFWLSDIGVFVAAVSALPKENISEKKKKH